MKRYKVIELLSTRTDSRDLEDKLNALLPEERYASHSESEVMWQTDPKPTFGVKFRIVIEVTKKRWWQR